MSSFQDLDETGSLFLAILADCAKLGSSTGDNKIIHPYIIT